MFLSLKNHWERSSAELTAALLQLSQLLLRSMRLHVVRGEEVEAQRFQSALLMLEQRVATASEAFMGGSSRWGSGEPRTM